MLTMGKKQGVEVRIKKRTLTVGGQIYLLHNLARVQSWKRVPDKGKIAYRVVRPALVALFALVGVNILLSLGGGQSAGMGSFNMLAGLVIVGVTAARYAAGVLRKPEYLLLLESTGYPIGVLSSTHKNTIDNLAAEIADAIENPPQTTRVIQLGDVVLGDQINQSGDSPIGKVVYGA